MSKTRIPAQRALTLMLAVALLALLMGGCSGSDEAAAPPAPAAVEPAGPPIDYVGEFTLEPSSGPIGMEVAASGSGFDANAELSVVWQDFDGVWKLSDDGSSYLGREFTQELVALATVRTNGAGAFETAFTVPDGFGFLHDVAVMQDGVIRNKSAFDVELEFTISPASGPVGTPITIEARGIGWQPLENSWELLYDNRFTGWLSAVTTRGHARAVIPATGAPGTHVLQVLHGAFTVPYMNMQQSPRPERPTFTFEFTVTDGPPVLPPPAATQGLEVERRDGPVGSAAGAPMIWTDLASGPVGTPLTLRGRGLPFGRLELAWYRVTGNRVLGEGWDEASTSLGAVTPGPDGQIELSFDAPDDLGGPHRIEALAGGEVVATTEFTITPSAFAVENASGPAGTIATIHLKGVGWTETANIYTVVYDNGYAGYSCGFNSQGDITIYLPLAGAPGWHFIDLYPAIYKGQEIKRVNNFRIPQLTYEADHPGERLPAFRFAVEVTEEASEAAQR